MEKIPEEHKIKDEEHQKALQKVRERIRNREQRLAEMKEKAKQKTKKTKKITRREGTWRNLIFNLLGRECWICGSRMDLELHHIIPLSEGGFNEIENIAVLCQGCHMDLHRKNKTGMFSQS